jgi:hypothetical protein
MAPMFSESEPPVGDMYRFVRQGVRVAWQPENNGNDHAQVARGEKVGIDQKIYIGNKQVLVDDAGVFIRKANGEIYVWDRSDTCYLIGDPEEARDETIDIMNSQIQSKVSRKK